MTRYAAEERNIVPEMCEECYEEYKEYWRAIEELRRQLSAAVYRNDRAWLNPSWRCRICDTGSDYHASLAPKCPFSRVLFIEPTKEKQA